MTAKAKPALAEVKQLPVANLRDTAAMLRGLANSIDEGHEKPRRVLCIFEEVEGVSLYRFGDVDTLGDIGLLAVAQARLARNVPTLED